MTPDASAEDIAKLVQATTALADIASTNPAVIDAIATGSTLLALFDTPRGLLDPVILAQALASGGLAAAIDVVYPPRPVTPSPSAPVSMIAFDSVEHGADDRDHKDHITKLGQADVTFTYSGTVRAGQSVKYTIDGGASWISTGIDASTPGVVVLKDVDLTQGALDLPPPPRMGVMDAGPARDRTTTLELRVVDGNDVALVSSVEKIVLDRFADLPSVALSENPAAEYFPGLSNGLTNVAALVVDGLEDGAIVQYEFQVPGAEMATWIDQMPELQDGLHTIKVRQLDAAGSASAAQAITFLLNRTKPVEPTIRLANDTGIDDGDGVTSDAR